MLQLLILLYYYGAASLLQELGDEVLGRCLGIGLGERFQAGCLHRKYSYGGGAAVLRLEALRYAVYCGAADGGAAGAAAGLLTGAAAGGGNRKEDGQGYNEGDVYVFHSGIYL